MKNISKIFFIFSGLLFVALGWIGAFLPGLPTVVFMILALACFARSSNRLHKWLYNHKLFGLQLQRWDKYRVIPPYAKIASISSMVLSLAYITIFTDNSVFVLLITASVMLIGAVYILSKPSYPPFE